jgi:hypothetical protein
MNYNIKILPLAKLELKEISIWYEKIQKGLGKNFLDSLSSEIQIIKKNPTLIQIRYDNTRVVLIDKFPYLIHFEIVKNEILIKAIIHTSRDSKIWEFRTDY